MEQDSSSIDQNASQPIVVRSSMKESERNVATGSQHGNQTPSMPELPGPSKEKAVPRDRAEDAGHTPTSTRKAIEELLVFLRARELCEKEKAVPQDKAEDAGHTPTSTRKAIEELLVFLRARELRENGIQGNFHSSPQPGAGYFAYPYSNPTAMSDAAHGSHGTPTPEYKMPWVIATNVHHHHHHHYSAPSVSPPPIIYNNNIVKINNKNTSNGSDSSESGDDGED